MSSRDQQLATSKEHADALQRDLSAFKSAQVAPKQLTDALEALKKAREASEILHGLGLGRLVPQFEKAVGGSGGGAGGKK